MSFTGMNPIDSITAASICFINISVLSDELVSGYLTPLQAA